MPAAAAAASRGQSEQAGRARVTPRPVSSSFSSGWVPCESNVSVAGEEGQ